MSLVFGSKSQISSDVITDVPNTGKGNRVLQETEEKDLGEASSLGDALR